MIYDQAQCCAVFLTTHRRLCYKIIYFRVVDILVQQN